MTETLVVGLGNRLVPEDSAGICFFTALRKTCRDNGTVEFIEGGTDLLRLAAHMRNRKLIVLIDTAANTEPGLTLIEHDAGVLSEEQAHAHHLSAVQALDLIRFMDDSVASARCVWALVH